MENPKISVIIPVFNTEEYVKEALFSIIDQTIDEIEIIVINDGSTDDSLRVVQELAGYDKRIKVISQDNQGQSVSRNIGLQNASGDYVYFMDSDDLLEKEALLNCYEKCEKEQLDFVFFDAEAFSEITEVPSFFNYYRAKNIEDRIYSGSEVLNLLLDKKIYRASVCLNFINRSFITGNGLTFYPGIIHEDELFTGLMYLKAERVGCIPEPYFKRRVRLNSTMTNQYSIKNINGYLRVVEGLYKHLESVKETNIRNINEKLIEYILDPSIYNAGRLSASDRMNVLSICLRKGYLKYISLKSMLVLLFPFTITVKGYFKTKPE